MRPASFRYIRPQNTAEALAALAEHGAAARPLAGGQSLVPLMNLRMSRPDVLVDLNRCRDLAFIERRGNDLVYGAMTRQIEAQTSALTLRHCPLIAKALALAGPVAVRNRGTLGGTLAHADRSAELPAVAAALDAVFVVDGVEGRREVPARQFFITDLVTDVGAGEMLCEVRFPIAEDDASAIFLEVGTRQRDMALAGLAAQLAMNADRNCRDARLALIGIEAAPLRLREIEDRLRGQRIDSGLIAALAQHLFEQVDPIGDLHANAGYRRHVAKTLLARALEAIAGGGVGTQ